MSPIHSIHSSAASQVYDVADASSSARKTATSSSNETAPTHLKAKRSPIDRMMARFRGERVAYQLNQQAEAKTTQSGDVRTHQAAKSTPILNAEYQQKFKVHMTLFKDFAAIVKSLEQRGEPFSHQQNLQRKEFSESLAQLEQMAPMLLEGKGTPDNRNSFTDMKVMAQYAKHDVLCERNVVALLMDKPKQILPLVNNMDSLSLLSKYVKDQMGSMAHTLSKSSPEVIHFLAQRKATLDHRLDGAMSEAALQQDITQMLGSAVEGFNQATLDARGHGAKGWLAKHSKLLKKMGVDVKTPAEFSQHVKQRIENQYGRLFEVGINKDKTLSVSVNPHSVGALPTDDFVKALDDIYHLMTKNYDKTAVKEAIKASPDVEWHKDAKGEKVLALTEQATERLTDAHASEQLSPQDKLQATVLRGVDDLKLSHLKVGLQQSFQDRVDEIKQKADSWFNLDSRVAGGKALIIDSLMKDLMDSDTPQQMLNLTQEADSMHDQLCDSSPLILNRGKTGELIDDMYKTIARYMSE